ncbi:polysaccharide deacetylase family protein [Microbispora sp. NPDC049125]|uniref:polysaccharide deacetylase family protein n=1 Tax=Microbispora sp. NPDC049125 TaxID=3154929 RepID=UPI0034674753
MTVIANMAVVAVALAVLALLPSPGADERTRPVKPSAVSPALPHTATAPPVTATAESAKKVGANEAGLIPVIMYHRLLPKRLASIDRTPAQVRREMERLAKDGYVPITAADFVSGKIDIPAGGHPVVLTFDDGNPSHFMTDDQGNPRNDTAAGIIYAIAAKYPSFRPAATFWINRRPFGLRDPARQAEAVHWLLGHGFEVGNHTYSHPDLHRLSGERVSEQIVRQERLIKKLGVTSSTTFALPYGSRPKKLTRAHDGSWDGTKYHFDGVFLAGAEPAISPYAKSFDRYAIPRIQSNGRQGDCRRWCTSYWLDWLDRHPRERYTSDGDPTHVSVPRKLAGKVAKGRAKAIIAY